MKRYCLFSQTGMSILAWSNLKRTVTIPEGGKRCIGRLATVGGWLFLEKRGA
ncbi:MAG: hypothetical protein ACETWC_08735 [Acidobacteriota bacterium]